MINTSIPIFGELVDCLQLSIFTFSITKLKLIIYFRKFHNGLPFRHSAKRRQTKYGLLPPKEAKATPWD
jgi:hypothetical protein